MNRQPDRPTDRHDRMNQQTDEPTDKQTNRYKLTDRQRVGPKDRRPIR